MDTTYIHGRCGRPRGVRGSLSSGFFADNGNVNASNFPNVGGNYNNGANCGPFYANFNNGASNTYAVRHSITLHPYQWEPLWERFSAWRSVRTAPALAEKSRSDENCRLCTTCGFGTPGMGEGRRRGAKIRRVVD